MPPFLQYPLPPLKAADHLLEIVDNTGLSLTLLEGTVI